MKGKVKMNRVSLILSLILTALSIAACASGNAPEKTKETKTTEITQITTEIQTAEQNVYDISYAHSFKRMLDESVCDV